MSDQKNTPPSDDENLVPQLPTGDYDASKIDKLEGLEAIPPHSPVRSPPMTPPAKSKFLSVKFLSVMRALRAAQVDKPHAEKSKRKRRKGGVVKPERCINMDNPVPE